MAFIYSPVGAILCYFVDAVDIDTVDIDTVVIDTVDIATVSISTVVRQYKRYEYQHDKRDQFLIVYGHMFILQCEP